MRKHNMAIAFGGVLICLLLLGVLVALIPTRMLESHTDKIVRLYFEDTNYSMESFENTYGTGESMVLKARDLHDIPVYYFENDSSEHDNLIILVHWHESNHKAMYPIAEEFLKKGFDVVLYDQRSHGKNTAKTVTFGLLESNDLTQVVDYALEKYNHDKVSILGQSMGAATVAFYSGTQHAKENVDCVIIDSAYSAMDEEVSWEITKKKDNFFGNMIAGYASVFSKVINGFGFDEPDILHMIEKNQIPTLIIHSREDKKCPFYMGQALYDNIGHAQKKFEVYDNSEHLFAYWDEPERYMESVLSFVGSCQ